MKARVKILSTTIDPKNTWTIAMADIEKLLSSISEIKEQNEKILTILNQPLYGKRFKQWVGRLLKRLKQSVKKLFRRA